MLTRLRLTVAAMTVAIWAIGATGAYADNPGDPLFCQPNEGTTFLIVNGGGGVFTANSDCFGGNTANNTHLTISTGNNGLLSGTNTASSTNYLYLPPTSSIPLAWIHFRSR